MAWLDFIKTIRRNDEQEKQRGGWWGNTLNTIDNTIDAGSRAVRGDFMGAIDQTKQGAKTFWDQGAGLRDFAGDTLQSIPRGVLNLGLGLRESQRDTSKKNANATIDEILSLSEDERNKLAERGADPKNRDPKATTMYMAKKQLGDLSDDALKKRKEENDKERQTHLTYKANNPVTKFLIGSEDDETAASPQKTKADAQKKLEEMGASSKVATPLAFAGAGIVSALDAPTGLGNIAKGVGKQGIKELAQEGTEDGVRAILKSRLPKLTEEAAAELAPRLAKAADEKAVKEILVGAGKDAVNVVAAPVANLKGKIRDIPLVGKKLIESESGDAIKAAEKAAKLPGLIDKAKSIIKPPAEKPTGYGEATDELLGRISYGSEIKKPKGGVKQQLKEQFVDKLSPINDLVKQVEDHTGRKFSTEDNPYELMRLYQGMPDKVQARVQGIADVLKQAPDLNSVKAIGMARQIIDRGTDVIDADGKVVKKAIGSTISVERARQVIEEQRAKLGDVAFDKAASIVDSANEYNRQLLDDLRQEGIISEDAYKAIIDTGTHYFSKFNVIDHLLKDDANRALFSSGGSYNTTKQAINKIVRTATGHEEGTQLLDPIESLVRSTDSVMRVIEKNRIWKAFDRMADLAPDLVQRVRDPEDVLKRIDLATDNAEMRPIRNGLDRLIKSRSRTMRRLETTINQLERKGLKLSLKSGGERMTDAKFAVDGLGGEVATSKAGVNKGIDFVVDEAGTARGNDAAIISRLGRARDTLNSKAEKLLPKAGDAADKALLPVKDFQEAVTMKRRAFSNQQQINKVLKDRGSAMDQPVNPSLLGPRDTGSFVRNLIERGSRSDIDKIKKMVGNRDAKLTALLDEVGTLKSQFDDVATTIRENVGKMRGELADKDVPEGFALISGFGKGQQGKIAVPKEVADVFTGKTKAQQDYLTSTMSTINGFVKQNFTSNNPAFALITNPIRDAKSFAYNAKDVKADPISIGRALAGGLAARIKKGDAYNRWIEAGGKSGFYADERTGETLAKDISRKINGVKINSVGDFVREATRFITTPLRKGRDALQGAASILEDAPRVAQFQASLKAGKSDLEAAFNARNVTVDFQQSGRIAQTINAWVPFLNARFQGSVKTVEAVKRNPARAASVYAGLTAAPIALAALNNQRFPDVMKMIPDSDRDNNFVIVFGDHQDESGRYDQVVKIPKSDVDKVLGNPLENFMRFLAKDDPDSVTEMVTNMIGSLSPLDVVKDDKFNPSRAVGSVLPPILKAPLEAVTNRNLYSDADIVPKSLQDMPAGEQIRRDDPNTKKVEKSTSKVAEFLAPLLGGGSPIKAENTLRNFTGSLLTEKPQDQLGGKLNGANASKMNNEFYKILNETTKNKNSASKHINDALASGDYAEAQRTAQTYNAYLREKFTPFGQTYGSQMTQELSDLYDQQKIVLTSRSIKQRQRNQLERQAAQE